MEFTCCKDCVYFSECADKESRDGCYFGEPIEDDGLKTLDWDRVRKRIKRTITTEEALKDVEPYDYFEENSDEG